MADDMTLPQLLTAARTVRDMTEQETCDAFKASGYECSTAYLKHVEKGRKNPGLDMLLAYRREFMLGGDRLLALADKQRRGEG